MKPYFSKPMATLLLLFTGINVFGQIPTNYYESLKGKSGAELKTAVYEIIKDANVLEYGSGTGHTWEGFYQIDRTDDNQVIDRYSNDVRYFTSTNSAISGMNIEHSFPKSWWGGSKNQAYQDLYNLMPCESSINSAKSNYPMGTVTTDKQGNGCTKVGTGSNGYQLWEPADKWKGDFARGYMYMATTYQNLTWSGTQALQILQNDTYPTLQQWAYKLYIEWAKGDPVSETETKRNEAVAKIQGNRNPFVDFPNLMEYIWGDSINYAFDPSNTIKTSSYTSDGSETTSYVTLYSATYTSSDGDCEISNTTTPSGFEVWTRNSSYGWTGTAYDNGTRYTTDATLLTPEIDLTDYTSPILSFTHAVNYCTTPSSMLAVEIYCDGNITTLDGFTWGTGDSWTFKSSGDISLDNFAGKKIQVAFHYKSGGTSTDTPTWEIKNILVKAKKSTTNIESAQKADFDATKPYQKYTVSGIKLSENSNYHGIVIVRQGTNSWKTRQ